MALVMKTWTSSTWPHPFIAGTTFESWMPLWVGHGESLFACEALVKEAVEDD